MTWTVLLAVGVGSFAFRLAPQLMLERVTLSPRVDRMLRDGGLAAVTALIAVSSKQSAIGSAIIPTFVALGTAVVLAARRASMLRLLAAGGLAYVGTSIVIRLFAG